MRKFTQIAGLLMTSLFILSLSACNKAPADTTEVKSAINELPVDNTVKADTKSKEIDSFSEEETLTEGDTDKPHLGERAQCVGVDDKQITDYRAGLFVPGSVPLAEFFDPSLTTNVEIVKNGKYFDVLFNYYKDGNKLIAQYECPQALTGNVCIGDDDWFREKYPIKKKGDQYVISEEGRPRFERCRPRSQCVGPDVKLNIFEYFLDENAPENKIIKTFTSDRNKGCENARKAYEAIEAGDLEQVKQLLPTTDTNLAVSSQLTCGEEECESYYWLDRLLLNAIKWNHTEIAQVLLENGADPNLSNFEIPYTGYADREDIFDALGWAVKKGNNEIIDLILPKMNAHTETLLLAACSGNNKIVKALLEKDASIINKEGFFQDSTYTPLSCALHGGSWYNGKYTPKHKEVIKTLIAYGADVNQPDPSGQDPSYCTPIQLAVSNNDVEIIQLLIDNGADVNLKKGYCSSCLKRAEKQDNEEILQLLKAAGAKE